MPHPSLEFILGRIIIELGDAIFGRSERDPFLVIPNHAVAVTQTIRVSSHRQQVEIFYRDRFTWKNRDVQNKILGTNRYIGLNRLLLLAGWIYPVDCHFLISQIEILDLCCLTTLGLA